MSLLERIRNGEGWCISELVHLLDDVHDTEGRPLGERRAPSAAKQGVEMVLRACPYPDSRRGSPMHVSALKQVMHHWDAAVGAIDSFHEELDARTTGFDRMLCAVVELLIAPGMWLVEHPGGQLPAELAVGHKLAAGFIALLRDFPSSPGEDVIGALFAHLTQHELLHGASEVCAGPEPLIRSAAVRLLGHGLGGRSDSPRALRARLVAAQLRLASAWRSFDDAFERWLLLGLPADSVHAASAFLSRELEDRRAELRAMVPPPAPTQLLPLGLAPLEAAQFERALEARPAETPGRSTSGRLALRFDGHEPELMLRAAHFREARDVLERAQTGLELRARATLPGVAHVSLGAMVVPHSRTRRWLEAAQAL